MIVLIRKDFLVRRKFALWHLAIVYKKLTLDLKKQLSLLATKIELVHRLSFLILGINTLPLCYSLIPVDLVFMERARKEFENKRKMFVKFKFL